MLGFSGVGLSNYDNAELFRFPATKLCSVTLLQNHQFFYRLKGLKLTSDVPLFGVSLIPGKVTV